MSNETLSNDTFTPADIRNVAASAEDNPLDRFVSSGLSRLDSQLSFVIEIDKMTHILRRTLLTDGSRRENDAEHSWHIAVMSLLFKEYFPEPVDCTRAAALCVVHDLVEVYAGDTFAFDKEGNKSKAAREEAAADKLFSMLPEEQGKQIRDMWEEFDAMKTAESRYANCMDRIQPFLHNTLTGGHTWLQASASLEDVHRRMAPVKENMPQVWPWIETNIQNGVKLGWIREN